MEAPARKPVKSWDRTSEEEASYRAMLAKCQKWSKPAEIEKPTPDAEQAEQILNPQLRWQRKADNMMLTACMVYQVTKEFIGQHVRDSGYIVNNGRIAYQCWKRTQWLWYTRLGPYQNSFADCQVLCEKDLADKGLPK